ncbi:MAG: SRPBCC domain-containing protein, partial [Actinomycetota bacterium]|nr:SRPBCC domain-containing protein [Actinomycetota bacterium]
MNGRLETVEGHPALRFERRLGHPVERVWRAVTEPAELARWFVDAVDWTPAVGEVLEAHGQRGQITELEPPHRIAWTFGADRFAFELRPDGRGCRLAFTHVFGDRSLAAQHAAGWEAYLDRLGAHLAGGFLSEEDAHAA